MMGYPRVYDEWRTLCGLLAGSSLARFGDGELKIMYGAGYAREPPNEGLTRELRDTFMRPARGCLLGVPTMAPGPKLANWERHAERFAALMWDSSVKEWYSAFISRPDSAPHIRCPRFARAAEALWFRRRATVVCQRHGSMLDLVRLSTSAIWIECPTHNAYAFIDTLEAAVALTEPEIAILSAGPTATLLANRLARRGIQAIDFGSAGGWLCQELERGLA